jgi:phosphotransferase system enzyme I (PtsI)
MNEKVAYLNSYFHPALLLVVKQICDSAAKHAIEVDICGQAGEIPELIPLWVAMGVDNLSVSIPSIPMVRKIICSTKKSKAVIILEKVLSMKTASEVETYLKSQFDKE